MRHNIIIKLCIFISALCTSLSIAAQSTENTSLEQRSVDLLQASYSPEPPTNQYGVENYADYMPYKNYEKFNETEKQGEPQIATIPSDG